ncbi:MAG: efflux RND transporter periplasmic adaptor subunit [Marinifilaceae bacterium]
MDSKRIVIVAMILSIGLIFQSCGGNQKKSEKKIGSVSVTIAEARLEDSPQLYSFSGQLEAEQHSNLSTRLMGQISEVKVEPGQKVKAGQILVQIRNKDILAKRAQVKANMVEAKTAFENAHKDYKRYQVLYQQKSASQKEMDDITTRYNMAKAKLEAVKQMKLEVEEMLLYTTIRAPYNGIITRKYVNDGDMANPGMPLIAMEKPGKFEVMARIPETEIGLVKRGDRVKVRVNALDGMLIMARISEVNPSALYTGNQYEAKVMLEPTMEQVSHLHSGMYVNVLMRKGGLPRIMVPKDVLVHRGQLTGLYTVSQGETALLRWVRVGKTVGDSVEILSGLADGEKYILSFKGKIWDGVKLNVQ